MDRALASHHESRGSNPGANKCHAQVRWTICPEPNYARRMVHPLVAPPPAQGAGCPKKRYCTATHLHVFQNKVWFMLCTKCGHVALRQVINSHHLMVLIQGVSIETPRFNLIRKNTDKVDGLESKNPFIFNFLPEAISKQLKRHFWLLSTTNLPSSISEILKWLRRFVTIYVCSTLDGSCPSRID